MKVLYTTPKGTVAFDRNFGIDISFIDDPLPIAQGRLMVEYRQKTRQYEPRAFVQEVIFDSEPTSGKLIPKVVIEIDLNA
ncbi:hypothetical protein [Gracilibacillus xinjiangensis]|uniref:Uncharacterized protein n=1 Tax=Gracilibacillus xinjiangensis TaxID=1193282 RepID=A0ABV8WUQ0_9BACI